ncbi:MAG TPA: LysR substrate-binding domain-containing protein, partial [Ramlibacter sp.]|nr:LysR substrate-binding domain-containing protein [Ramlibacter sp.]
WLRGLESKTALGPVELISDVMQRCEALMAQRKVQFVLGHAHPEASGPLDEGAYLSAQVGQDKLMAVSSPDAQGQPIHRLGGRGAQETPLLQYAGESGLGRIVRAVVGRRLEALPVRVAFTAHLASVLRTMALDGRGVAWLPETLVGEDMSAGRLVAAAGDDWSITLAIRLYKDRGSAGSAAEAFWATAVRQARLGDNTQWSP